MWRKANRCDLEVIRFTLR